MAREGRGGVSEGTNIPAQNRQHNIQGKVLVGAAPEVDGQGRDEEGGRVEDSFAGFVTHCVGVGVYVALGDKRDGVCGIGGGCCLEERDGGGCCRFG